MFSINLSKLKNILILSHGVYCFICKLKVCTHAQTHIHTLTGFLRRVLNITSTFKAPFIVGEGGFPICLEWLVKVDKSLAKVGTNWFCLLLTC
jgi:hypothetical protein